MPMPSKPTRKMTLFKDGSSLRHVSLAAQLRVEIALLPLAKVALERHKRRLIRHASVRPSPQSRVWLAHGQQHAKDDGVGLTCTVDMQDLIHATGADKCTD